MAAGFQGFPPETLRFLRQLKRNNNREWFLAHKQIYEEKVKAPMAELVTAVGSAMQGFAPELEADPKKAIYRIYRDIRFSADKSPYKTHIAAFFAPRGMHKNSCAGLYFHIAPDELIIAGGIYMPDAATLRLLRQYIAGHWEQLAAVADSPEFKRLFGGLQGERLMRPPRGFPADHPAAEFLRHKHFIVSVEHDPKFAETPKLFPSLLKHFAAMMPLVRYVNRGLK